MLQPKKPIKKSNQTTGEFNALMKEYKVNLRKYELDNNPNQLEGETNESYNQRKKYNDFRIKQVEDKNPVKKWYNEMDASQEEDPNFLRKTVRKVATSPVHVANYLHDEINLNDTKKYKSTNKKAKERIKAGGSALDVLGLATMGTLDKGMKAKPIVDQLLTKGTTFFGGNKIQDEVEDGLDKITDYLTNSFTSEKDMKKDKLKNKLPKYALGTYVGNPMDKVYQSQIDRAYAGANNSGLVDGLNMFGTLATQVGGKMMSAGSMDGDSGFAKFVNNNKGDIMSGINMAGAYSQFLAMGGEVGGIPVEVEGEEVGQTPQGKLMEFDGPSHEAGGIPISLPPGTEIYSKRIKVDGVSMADRKKSRERKTVTLESLFEKNKTDALIKNSLKRTQENNQIEEDSDNKIQMVVKQLLDKQENQKFKNGGIVGPKFRKNPYANPNNYEKNIIKNLHDLIGITPDTEGYGTAWGKKSNQAMFDYEMDNHIKDSNKFGVTNDSYMDGATTHNYTKQDILDAPETFNDYGLTDEGSRYIGPDSNYYANINKNFPNKLDIKELTSEELYNKYGKEKDPFAMTAGEDWSKNNPLPEGVESPISNGINFKPKYSYTNTSKDSVEGSEGFKMSNLLGGATFGDMLGMAGNFYQADKIMKTIKQNRAGDTPNINAFKDYGKDGLETLDSTKQYVNQIRDKKLKDLELSRTGSVKRNSNSARGINTVRALNLATDASVNNSKEETYNAFAEQMMGILGQQAGMENQRDEVVMRGEDTRDDRDRQDRDNYFSQLITGYKNKGQVMSETGRNLNQIKSNEVGLKAVNNMTNYVQDDGNGNISLKPGVTIVGSSVQKDGKEIAKLSDKEVLELHKKGLLTQKGT